MIWKKLIQLRKASSKKKKIIRDKPLKTQEVSNPLLIKELEEELEKIRAIQKAQGSNTLLSDQEEGTKTKEEITAISRRKNIIRKKLIKLRDALEAQESSNLLLINEFEDELKLLSAIQDLR